MCPNRFISSEVKFLNRNSPFAYTLKEDLHLHLLFMKRFNELTVAKMATAQNLRLYLTNLT
jgi:hypothetical protein